MMDNAMNDKKITEIILKHALEIVFLLTGDQYVVVKIKAETPPCNNTPCVSDAKQSSAVSPPTNLQPQGRAEDQNKMADMIVKHASNIIHLLSGEVPVRYDNVAMYFTTDELQYLEEHKELYKDIMESYQASSSQGPCVAGSDEKMEKSCVTFPPEEANKVANNDSTLIQEVKDFICNECGKGFDKKRQFVNHVRNHKGEKPYVCRTCGRGFTCNSHLIIHERTHSGERPFVCNDCGKGFISRYFLISHQRSHTGEITCPDCGKSFINNSTLAKHRRIHTGEKPFICSICGKAFSQKSALVIHVRTHTGERPFACSECEKSFSSSSALVNHKRIHTGEKPYVCKTCGKCFPDPSNLYNHQKTHTTEGQFACTECEKRFHHKSHFLRHQRKHQH